MSIPKIIHFCWFGKGEYPDLVKKCIDTWHNKMPDYEIKIWNEDNFDVNRFEFTEEAYKRKRWAFVSDVARLVALYEYGGVYLDTDVELVKNLDNTLINEHLVLGRVEGGLVCTSFIAAEKECRFIGKILDFYSTNHFEKEDGTTKEIMNTLIFSYFLNRIFDCPISYKTFKNDEVNVLPLDYFSPFRKNILGNESNKYSLKNYRITNNTFAVHHDLGTWYKKGRINRVFRGLVRLLAPSTFYLALKVNKQRKSIKTIEIEFKIPN